MVVVSAAHHTYCWPLCARKESYWLHVGWDGLLAMSGPNSISILAPLLNSKHLLWRKLLLRDRAICMVVCVH